MKRKLLQTRCIRSLTAAVLLFFCAVLLLSCDQTPALRQEQNTPVHSGRAAEDSAELPDPWDTVSRVVACIQSDRSDELMKYIYPLALERYGKEQIVERNAAIHRDLGIQSILYNNLLPLERSESGKQAYYTAEAIYSGKYGELKKNVTLSFIWHPAAGAWQLDWSPSVILPGLGETGEVRLEVLPARRGRIYDRDGWPLALEESVARVSLIPGQFDRSRISEVNELLKLEEGVIESRLAQSWVRDDTLVPIGILPGLQEVDYKKFNELGLRWDEQLSRSYPFGAALAGLIGYVGQPTEEDLALAENRDLRAEDLIGRSGLERIYDRELRGKNGYRIYISTFYEQTLMEEPAIDGKDLRLTIDAVAQRALYEVLKDKQATVTGIDPTSGEILFLLSTPSYNPMSFVTGISNEEYNALLEDPRHPLDNKFSSLLTPGSTQKLATAMAALNNGSLTPGEEMEIVGKTWQPDDSWGNYYVTRYQEVNGLFDLADAISYSDNIFFARTALKMGAAAFNRGLKELGFASAPCAEYPFPASQISNAGLISEEQTILLADSGYGQGELLVTPVHLCSIYGALCSNGSAQPLTLLLSGKADPQRPGVGKQIVSPAYVEGLRDALKRVAEEQYPGSLASETVSLSGKSGTAEIGFDENGEVRVNSWFVGFERDNPHLCLSVTLFDSQTYDEEFYAVKLFRKLFETLWQKGEYAPPAAQLDLVRKSADVPASVPLQAEEDERGRQDEESADE